MTYIKRLKIKGFKSFANPTVLIFEKCFNTIIGANGSGKSNIFDALCFVLGRMSSKGLRSEKLGNLVFNGGKDGKPAKEAVVEVYIDNKQRELCSDDIDEVKITRIINRDGSSKYFFNNKKTTRNEIVTMLRRVGIDPDGYNIILQGDIQRIVNMTNNERRELIEEISDIHIYEEKREKSIKKLNEIEGQLREADLLLEEKTKYIRELKGEKELAEKYFRTKDSLLFNNILLVKAKIEKNKLLKRKKEDELRVKELKIQEVRKELSELEKKEEDIDKEIEDFERRIELESHKDFIELNNKINEISSRIDSLNEKIILARKSIKEMQDKKSEIELNIKKNEEEKKQLLKKRADLEKELSKKEKELESVKNKISKEREALSGVSVERFKEIDDKIKDVEEELEGLLKLREDYKIKIEKINAKISYLEKDLDAIKEKEKKNKELFAKLDTEKKNLKKLILKVSELSNNDSELAARIGSLKREIEALLDKYTTLKSRVEHSKHIISGNKAVEVVLSYKSKDTNVHGTVSELGSVDSQYSAALETAGGNALFNIVVEDEDTAIKYINLLKEKKVGRATFLPINKINPNIRLDKSVLAKEGVIDYAINLINYDPKYDGIFKLIYQDTLVIESIDYAKSIGIGNYRMVTLDGDLVMKSGALSGGYRSNKKTLNLFKDDKIEKEFLDTENRLNTLRDSLELLKSEKEEVEKELYETRQRKAELEGEIAKLEKLLEVEGKDSDHIFKEIDLLKRDRKLIEKSLKGVSDDIEKITKKKELLIKEREKLNSSLTKSDKINKLDQLMEEESLLKDKILEIKREVDNINLRINNILEIEDGNLKKILKKTETAIEEAKKEISLLMDEVNKKKVELNELKKKEKGLSKDYHKLIEERDKKKLLKKKIDDMFTKVNDKFVKLKEDMAKLTLQIEEYDNINKVLENELEVLFEELKSEKDNDEEKINEFLNKIKESLSHSIDIKALQNRVNSLKAKLNSFGTINLKAVQIYDQLSEEYNNLLKKREDLNKDKKEIETFIEELDQKKKEIFLDTFNKLKENFTKIYSMLSSKGVAELVLEDPNDIFNNGVQIRIKLSQRNTLDIKSLSGGEKTITALAFIFAVQEFNPASFYIFDEVDAALDSFNAEKLGKLIKKYSEKAQYIVVSHNENLIRSSDIIYGVTMDSKKISDVVSLRFDEIDKSMLEESE